MPFFQDEGTSFENLNVHLMNLEAFEIITHTHKVKRIKKETHIKLINTTQHPKPFSDIVCPFGLIHFTK